MLRRLTVASAAACLLALAGCATESSRSVPVEKVQSAAAPYAGVRLPVSVGKFDNRSSFMRGVFSDGVDRLGSQAKTTLIAHLQQSQRFAVLDRDNMSETSQEAKLQGTAQTLRGASYVVTGDIKIYSKYIGTSARKAAKIEADIQEILKRQATTATGAANDH